MCLAIPAKIEAFIDEDKHFAMADIAGVKRQINVDLLRATDGANDMSANTNTSSNTETNFNTNARSDTVANTNDTAHSAHTGVAIGDWVLIHVGFAMSKISEQQAQEQLQILAMLGQSLQSQEEADGYTFELNSTEK